jgi:hypothetical protein
MLAAQLNELGISPQQSQPQPEAPPRNNRSQSATAAGGKQTTPSNNNNNNQPVNPLDPIDTSDSDSEPDEPNDQTRNDGTLLASDPPKPLWVELEMNVELWLMRLTPRAGLEAVSEFSVKVQRQVRAPRVDRQIDHFLPRPTTTPKAIALWSWSG